MAIISRSELHQLIDQLPEPILPEVAKFVEFMKFKLDDEAIREKTFAPLTLGGLWQGLDITDEDIARIRQEMWQNFGEIAE